MELESVGMDAAGVAPSPPQPDGGGGSDGGEAAVASAPPAAAAALHGSGGTGAAGLAAEAASAFLASLAGTSERSGGAPGDKRENLPLSGEPSAAEALGLHAGRLSSSRASSPSSGYAHDGRIASDNGDGGEAPGYGGDEEERRTRQRMRSRRAEPRDRDDLVSCEFRRMGVPDISREVRRATCSETVSLRLDLS
eukprot:365083-Chlamydomonas_euryale.AAC.34